MLVRILERSGHSCVVAHNGQEAIDAYKANRDDVSAIPFDTSKCLCMPNSLLPPRHRPNLHDLDAP